MRNDCFSPVILGPDPRTFLPGDPRVEPEDDADTMMPGDSRVEPEDDKWAATTIDHTEGVIQ